MRSPEKTRDHPEALVRGDGLRVAGVNHEGGASVPSDESVHDEAAHSLRQATARADGRVTAPATNPHPTADHASAATASGRPWSATACRAARDRSPDADPDHAAPTGE